MSSVSRKVVWGSSRSSESSKEASKTTTALSKTKGSTSESSRKASPNYTASPEAKTYTGQPAKVVQVALKLEKHRDYKNAGIPKLLKKAGKITNENYFLDKIFGDLLKDCELIKDAVSDDENLPPGSGNPREVLAKRARSKCRLEAMCDLPIVLYLRFPDNDKKVSSPTHFTSWMRYPFGPMHAALKVGDVLLEWDESSLVLPRSQKDLALEERKFVFVADIRHSSRTHPSVTRPTEDKEIEVLKSKMHDKVELIKNLIKVIIRYNGKFYYNVVSRNCQSFVLDAAQALGIKDQLHFQDPRLKNYFEELRTKGKAKGLQQFFLTHVELDTYISARNETGDLEKDDVSSLEYFNATFASFHYKDKKLTKCEVPGCQQPRVHDLLLMKLKQLTPAEIEAFARNEDLAVSI